jgi:hypothetical protein
MKLHNALSTAGSRHWALVSACASVAMVTMACGGGAGGGNEVADAGNNPVTTPVLTPVPTPVGAPVPTPEPTPVLTPAPAPVTTPVLNPVAAPVPILPPGPGPAPAPVAKTWKTPSLIETSDAGDALYPAIAVDASGNAIAVWSQANGMNADTYANRYTPVTGWGTAQLIGSVGAGKARNPQIATDGSGNAIAVWTQLDNTEYSIWSNRYTPTSGWGSAILLEADAGNSFAPKIVIDPVGSATVIWSQNIRTSPTSASSNIWAKRFTLASGWMGTTLLGTDNSLDTNLPEVAADSSGNVIATWRQFDGNRFNIAAKRFTPETGWSSMALIATNDVGTANFPRVAFDASGNAIAVWQQANNRQERKIWANRYIPATGWGQAQMIQTNSDVGNALNPTISVDRAGNAIALWHQSAGGPHNIWSNRFSPTLGWGNDQLIESGAGGALFPEVKFDNDGNAIAVWSQSDGSRNDIWANRFTLAGGWSGAVLIETNDGGEADSPQIAIDASGNAIVVWSQASNQAFDSTRRYSIWSARFD